MGAANVGITKWIRTGPILQPPDMQSNTNENVTEPAYDSQLSPETVPIVEPAEPRTHTLNLTSDRVGSSTTVGPTTTTAVTPNEVIEDTCGAPNKGTKKGPKRTIQQKRPKWTKMDQKGTKKDHQTYRDVSLSANASPGIYSNPHIMGKCTMPQRRGTIHEKKGCLSRWNVRKSKGCRNPP